MQPFDPVIAHGKDIVIRPDATINIKDPQDLGSALKMSPVGMRVWPFPQAKRECPPVSCKPHDRPVNRKDVLACGINRLKDWGHAHDNPLRDRKIESTLDVIVPKDREREFTIKKKGNRFDFAPPKYMTGMGIIRVTAWGLRPTTPRGGGDRRKTAGGYNDTESTVQVYWKNPRDPRQRLTLCRECKVRIVVPRYEALGPRASIPPVGTTPSWFNFGDRADRFLRWHSPGTRLPPPRPRRTALLIGTEAFRFMAIRILDQFGDPVHVLYQTPQEARGGHGGEGAASVLYEKFTKGTGVFLTEFARTARQENRNGWIWMNGWPDAGQHGLYFPSTILHEDGVARDFVWLFVAEVLYFAEDSDQVIRDSSRDRSRNTFSGVYSGRLRRQHGNRREFSNRYGGEARQHLCVWGHELEGSKMRRIRVWPRNRRESLRPVYDVRDDDA